MLRLRLIPFALDKFLLCGNVLGKKNQFLILVFTELITRLGANLIHDNKTLLRNDEIESES